MPIKHSIWRVGASPVRLPEGTLSSEMLLEEMIVASPEILSDQWMIIGRQADTGYGGRIDLLAVAPDVVDGKEQLALEALTGAEYHRRYIGDPDKMEYFVPVKWSQTVPLESAIDEIGLFGNQNTACAPKTPKWTHTVERLKKAFSEFDAK